MLEPPKPSDVDPAELFRLFLEKDPIRPIDWRIDGIDERFFVRAIGSFDWVRLHRKIAKSFGIERAHATHDLLAHVVVDADCRPVFASPKLLTELYDYEVDRLIESAYVGLSVVSPTYASCDVGAWLDRLKEGALDPGNWADMLSLSGCHSISFGMGKGAVNIRHEPEAYFGVPRRELLDCHWFAYRAAMRAQADLNK